MHCDLCIYNTQLQLQHTTLVTQHGGEKLEFGGICQIDLLQQLCTVTCAHATLSFHYNTLHVVHNTVERICDMARSVMLFTSSESAPFSVATQCKTQQHVVHDAMERSRDMAVSVMLFSCTKFAP